jgi:uncharacterized repeat protein (TIGR01451 family)
VNTATVTAPSGVTDPTPGNNTATDTDNQNSEADLSISKTDNTLTYTPGTTTTYTIVVNNAGPSDVTGATVTDLLPAGVTWSWSSSIPSSGTGDINEMVNLASGASIIYTVIVTIPSDFTGTLNNTATITAPMGVTDPTPGNNTATDSDMQASQADLSITKTDNTSNYTAGTTTTYTIVASNAGPSDVTGATIMDLLPSGVTWTWSSSIPSSGTGDINEMVNLASGASITYTVIVTIPSDYTGTLDNTAIISVPVGVTDPTPGNNIATDTDSDMPVIDLSISKTDNSTSYTAGAATIYTMVVYNAGPSDVTGATVTDNIPAGTSWTYTAMGTAGTSGFTASGSTDINDEVNIPSGGSITYTITLMTPSNFIGNLVNTAMVIGPSDEIEINLTNNSATDTDTPNPMADLSISKTDGVDTYTPGTTTSYTVVVSNLGPSDALGATVLDNAPAGTTITSWTAVFGGGASGILSGGGNINELVDIPVGGTITYTITLTIPSSISGDLANTAAVIPPSGVTDPTPGNNTATDTDTQDIEVPAIPTLSQWSLIILGLCLLVFSIVAIRQSYLKFSYTKLK